MTTLTATCMGPGFRLARLVSEQLKSESQLFTDKWPPEVSEMNLAET